MQLKPSGQSSGVMHSMSGMHARVEMLQMVPIGQSSLARQGIDWHEPVTQLSPIMQSVSRRHSPTYRQAPRTHS
jgi:hypothetical protein